MVVGVIVAVAIVGAIVGAIAVLVRGGRNAMDFAPRNLVRLYLYIASMAGIIVLVVGLSGVLTVGFAAAFGNGFVYGDSSAISIAIQAPACPPHTCPNVKCVPPPQQDFTTQRLQQPDRHRPTHRLLGLS